MNASVDFLSALTGSLVHFLWQGAAIAALAAALMYFFKSPATRYLLGLGALVLMLASFAVTFSVLRGSPGNGAEMILQLPAHVAGNTWIPDASAPLSQAPVVAEHDFLWVARAWLVGVFALALRIAFGLLVIEQLRRRNLVPLPAPLVARFSALQQRLGIQRAIRYCECQMVRVPAVIGLFRPIVLIPVRALTGLSAEQLEAVVAHELGHIKRFDVAVNFFQVIAETLFFFHPAVWWLNRRIRADREECCDDVAVSVSGASVGYAHALAAMAGWRDVPHLAMAATGSPIGARVARLLGMNASHSGARTAGMFTASLVLAAAMIAGGLSIGLVKPAHAGPADDAASLVAQTEVAPPAAPVEPASAAEPPSPASPAVRATPAVRAKPAVKAKAANKAVPAVAATPAQPQGSYIDEMKSAGLDNLDVDQLISLRIQGVTSEYVRDMRGTGLNPDVSEFVALKVQDVTPEYVKEIRDLGFTPNTQEIIAMKVQDVTPEYVREIRSAGFTPDAQEVIAMRVQDVSPAFRQALERAGYKLNVQELIQAKVMEITPEFIEQARAHGFKNLEFQKLIQLKVADVF